MASPEGCEGPGIPDNSLYIPDIETVCTICNAEFLDPQDLDDHLKQIHKALIYCKFCSTSVTDNLEYAIHIRNEHLKSLKSCMFCTKIFVDYDQYRKHERRHYSGKKNKHSCSQCSDMFDEPTELERHEYEQHNNEYDGYMMLDFFPILSTVLNMKAVSFFQAVHSASHFECHQCGYKSLHIDLYVKHLQRKKCSSFSCDNCSTTYKSKKQMLRHLLRHNECFNFASKEKTRRCPECQEDILSRFYYCHIKQCKPIKCGPCDIVFQTMYQFSEHQAKEHPLSIEVKFCKFCSRQCVGSYALARHMVRVHKHEIHLYKYKCTECDTPFKHPQKLFAHYYNRHKNLEPYTCKICDKKFRIRRRFTIHIKLNHNSVGFVEFDKKYRVYFDDKKSPKPFLPTCVLSVDELSMFSTDDKKNCDENVKTDAENSDTLQVTKHKDKPKKPGRRKRKLSKPAKKKAPDVLDIVSLESSDIDDDVPLVSLKKKTKPNTPLQVFSDRRQKSLKDNKKQLTCNICQKYCYTFQNYQHHMSLHRKHDVKVCIKCSKEFRSKKELNKHIETDHSSSKLTETLKSLLEKRNKTSQAENAELTPSERFQQTIKRTKTSVIAPAATIIQLNNGLSVKKYLETFTPEGDTLKPLANVIIEDSISIKTIKDPFFRKPVIKLTKFDPKPTDEHPKLKYPVRFKPVAAEDIKIKVKLVQSNCVNDLSEGEDYNSADKGDSIPDVAQEVMLDSSEEPKIVQIIPNLNADISIGHLQEKAPYYKIVKVSDVGVQDQPNPAISKDLICLPDGTRLITVNPLAHLLGDKNVDDILKPPKYKYYKPKMSRDVENMLTKALEKAKTPTNAKKRMSKGLKKLQDSEDSILLNSDE